MNAYYLTTWLMQTLFSMVYPIVAVFLMYMNLGFADTSSDNFYAFLKTAVLLAFTGSNFGLMWGTFFDNEMTAINSAFLFALLFSLGGGKFINLKNKSPIVKYLSNISPVRYAVERFFRRIVSQNEDYDTFLLSYFGFNQGDEKCEYCLIGISITFFVIGWLTMHWKGQRL